MPATAEQLYAAFRSVCPVDQNGDMLPPLEELKDGGRGWFAIANSIDTIAAPQTDITEPYEYELTPIPPRVAGDGLPIQESEDERPSKITIRGFTAADLCTPHMDERMLHEVFANAVGVDIRTIETRMDPADVELGIELCSDADGSDSWSLCRQAYVDGGGTQNIGEVVGNDDDSVTLARILVLAWQAVAKALLVDVDGDVARVRCRTPGVGVLTIGPLRAEHLRLHKGTAAREVEWKGRLVALAKASGRSVGQLLALRPEDAVHAWDGFEELKKKVEQRKTSKRAALRSSTSSVAGGQKTSTT